MDPVLSVPNITPDMATLDAALAYMAAGWYVVPLAAGTKNPGSVLGKRWPELSSRDPEQAVAWWAGTSYGIALHVGRSGAVVFDVDRPEKVPEELALLIWPPPHDSTWTPHQTTRATSPNGGHYVFRMPPGRTLGNSPGRLGGEWGEVRGMNGVIVVAPSVHEFPNGEDGKGDGRYLWEWAGEVPELPEAIAGLLPDVGESVAGELDIELARAWLGACRTGAACAPVVAVLRAVRWTDGGRHETALSASRALAGFGGEGHRGAREALARLAAEFSSAVGRERAAGEWPRMLAGAVALAMKRQPTPATRCSCEPFGSLPEDDLFAPPGGGGLGGAGAGGLDPWDSMQSAGADGAVTAGVTAVDGAPDQAFDGAVTVVGGAGDGAPRRSYIPFMLTPEQMRSLPPPRPLVLGLLDLDSLAWMIAAPGSYKSFVALDLAAHVGLGRSWMGRRVHQGPVVYLVAEGGTGMGLRVRAWEKQHGEMKDVMFLPFPVQASNIENWGVLVEDIRQLRPALVVLDTQARITVGMKENDNTDMGVFIEAAEQLRRACGGCVLVVHHTGRADGDARGASAIDGAQGTELRVKRTADFRAVLTLDKQKDGADDARIELELLRVEGGVDPETERDLSSLVVVPPLTGAPVVVPDWIRNLTETRALVVGVVADHFAYTGSTRAEAVRMLTDRGSRRSDGTVVPRTTFNTAWDKLVQDGVLIRIEGTQRYVLASLSQGSENGSETSMDREGILSVLRDG